MANETKPLFRPGQAVTALTTAAVTGKTCVAISATIDATTKLVKVATAGAGVRAFGVAGADIASGATGLIQRGGIIPVTAGAAITAGAEVEVGTGGKVITLASGKAVGMALETGANNVDCLVWFYN